MLTLVLFSLLINGCTPKVEQFVLKGTVKGLADYTQVLLMDANSMPVDSTVLMNEKFTFQGKVEEPTQFFILIESTMDFQSIWLENTEITFIGETKKFTEATILGAPTQDVQTLLNKQIAPLNKALEPIKNQYIARYYQYPDSIFNDSITAKYQAGEERRFEIIKDFIQSQPNTIVSVKALNDAKTIFKKEVTNSLYQLMTEEIQGTEFGSSIKEYITLSQNLEIGGRYIDFEQENSLGKKIRFSNHLGAKYTLLEFWASWCGPCRSANPQLVQYYQQYQAQGFEIFGVSLDTEKAQWLQAIEKDQLPWGNVSDLKGYQNKVALSYNIAGLPNSILLDDKGVIIAIGLRDGTLKTNLEELFNN